MADKELISIEEHNRRKMEQFSQPATAPSGVECPRCGGELQKDMTRVLASLPPRHRAFCPECGFLGSIL